MFTVLYALLLTVLSCTQCALANDGSVSEHLKDPSVPGDEHCRPQVSISGGPGRHYEMKEDLYWRISRAHDWLFRKAAGKGHWEYVRATSLAAIALAMREPLGSDWLNRIEQWLIEQQEVDGDSTATWCYELWDTSVALMALRTLGAGQDTPCYRHAVNWILEWYDRSGQHNWHSDPWETAWCLIVIVESNKREELVTIATDATRWLLELQDSQGKIISPHYTAYFIRIASELLEYNLDLSDEDKRVFRDAISKGNGYLWNGVSDTVLWTGEPWSNGQILWALSLTRNLPPDMEMIETVVGWFAANQDEDEGNWEDIEDTACCIIGLSYLLRELERRDGFRPDVRGRLRSVLATPALRLGRKFIEQHDDGYISINLSRQLVKTAAIMIAIMSFAVAAFSLRDHVARFAGRFRRRRLR